MLNSARHGGRWTAAGIRAMQLLSLKSVLPACLVRFNHAGPAAQPVRAQPVRLAAWSPQAREQAGSAQDAQDGRQRASQGVQGALPLLAGAPAGACGSATRRLVCSVTPPPAHAQAHDGPGGGQPSELHRHMLLCSPAGPLNSRLHAATAQEPPHESSQPAASEPPPAVEFGREDLPSDEEVLVRSV